jgi:glutamyl-tRNA synthetase
MNVRVRFAPSPSGHLHVGGARTALFNYLLARSRAGTFVLRIEDTDASRSNDASVRAILDSLRWLGLRWDEGPGVGGGYGPYAQSQRRDLYLREANALLAGGLAYRCWCTQDELETRRRARTALGETPAYDGRCRSRTDADRARFEAEGRPCALRFALPDAGEVGWDDLVRGRVSFQSAVLEDFVLLRSDGLPTYNFACVVDDHAMEITHVVRGDDHISNTPRQLLLYRAFGWAPPQFAHVPMILGSDGSRLSKRHGATSVEAFRELGILPEAMVNFLALLGWSFDGQRELFDLPELERVFALERVGSHPAVFNLEKLQWMNGQHLRRLPEAQRVALVVDFLATRGHDLSGHPPEWRTRLVRAIGDRMRTLADVEAHAAFVLEERVEMEEAAWNAMVAKPRTAEALEALAVKLGAVVRFDLEELEAATRGLAAERGMKAGELIGTARVALTGRGVSLGIFEVMALLGRDRTLERLTSAARRLREERARA